jgi:hypothetical protein
MRYSSRDAPRKLRGKAIVANAVSLYADVGHAAIDRAFEKCRWRWLAAVGHQSVRVRAVDAPRGAKGTP